MKIVKTGGEYNLYGNDLIVNDNLAPAFYSVCFHEKRGFWLEDHDPIVVNEDKVYGVHNEKINKVIKNYSLFNRNLGVILSGAKGIGKSLFAKLLSQSAVEIGLPVIIVDRYYPGIANFLESIEQEVMVLFDEFDKTFSVKVSENNADAQASMLTLFDGISQGKKLFVVTCNDLSNMNSYLVNRPGRFHYHFRFDYPNADEIREYLEDKIDPEYYGEIQNVIEFANKINLNYDCLRAIAFELNSGLPFAEAILDLNIININGERYFFELCLANGKIYKDEDKCDLFGNSDVRIQFYDADCSINFNTAFMSFDPYKMVYTVPFEHLEVTPDFYLEDKKKAEFYNQFENATLFIKKMPDRNLHYAV